MTLTDDSHTLNPALPRPPTRMGPGSTSWLPTSQAPTGKPNLLNLYWASLRCDTDSNPSPYQGQD